jgi:energy-converting hydrogenase A subunit Q
MEETGKVFELDKRKCFYCGGCVSVCPTLAITLYETRVECDESKCIKCKICETGCPIGAIKINK